MSHVASHRGGLRAVVPLVAFVTAVVAVVAAIGVTVESAPVTRAPLEAVFRIEGLGCKRNPTRTVGTVVTEPLADGGQLLLTVAHGVVGQDAIELVDGETRVPLRLVAVDGDWDLALLQVGSPLRRDDGNAISPVPFSEGRVGNASFVVFEGRSEGVSEGQSELREVAVPRPAHVAKRLRIRTEDIYLRDVETRTARPSLEVRTVAVVGDSGGPLFDVNGEMIGLVWGTSRKSAGRSWATRVQAAAPMIDTTRAALQRENTSFESLRLLACAP